jgi:hypothetical protein
MNLSEDESLDYLEKQGFKISRPSYYRIKKIVKESRFDRLTLIAKEQFVDSHLQRIDQLETINQEYWKLYRDTKDTFKKALILEKIAELQTYISPYYDASRSIMEHSIQHEKDKSISST